MLGKDSYVGFGLADGMGCQAGPKLPVPWPGLWVSARNTVVNPKP